MARTLQDNEDLWMLPLEGDRLPWVFLKTPFEERQGTCSPDGRWVANTSNESGSVEIYVRPFAGPDGSGAPIALIEHWNPEAQK